MKTKKLEEKNFPKSLELRKITISKMNLVKGGGPGGGNTSFTLGRTRQK
ncbi:hypothetical protein UJ101_01074 [Flavobacteriaceae bacterium UJ101]|nr:hypothetical protein UJ101_01074 [Flavobacteriaceae bacterium UJ101]